MKTAILPLTILLLASNVASAESDTSIDEFEYLETPVAEQIDDLIDDDRDGVINARDLCPETPLKAEIDNDGCATYVKTEQTMQLHILFANDSSNINPAFLSQIRSMAKFLKDYPSTSIELQGYASKVGNHKYNQKLSEKRAQEVQSALINNGISHSRIQILGFGDTNLEELGDDEVSHAMNRKVVATVVGHKGSVKEEWTIFNKIEK
ncbi:OmpA family protein [Vibrio sp. SCSIO 43135]|uniref:OmpA family protein n=1 Tax=Vibrio sp. SCSIO 43135 TaxID=2819096 RepID=UPI0020761756|nr:OmpA family protein [Vibrio sp. SCSIO 43135]USD42447.1 OmpA family protein [Vibrio sp. SCSIO 43135]